MFALIGQTCCMTFSIHKLKKFAETKKHMTTLESIENFAIDCLHSWLTSVAVVLRQQTSERENSSSRATIKIFSRIWAQNIDSDFSNLKKSRILLASTKC